MKKIFVILLLLIFSIREGDAQEYIKQMLSLLQNKKFENALNYGSNKINELKKINKSDKQLEILTYLSLCLDPESHGKGCEAIDDYFKIHERSLQFLPNLYSYQSFTKTLCSSGTYQVIPVDTAVATITIHTDRKSDASFLAHFKSYEFVSANANPQSILRKLTQYNAARLLNYEEPAGRVQSVRNHENTKYQLFSIDHFDTDTIKNYVASIFGTSNFLISKHLVVISPSYTKDQLSKTSLVLEKTLNFYSNSLHLDHDPHLIFVYLSNKYESLSLDIENIDHLSRWDTELTIGYSNLSANTIFAWIPAVEKAGTVKHELIHILFKGNLLFPDWFEEGLAATYEESSFMPSGQLVGAGNWRIAYLKMLDRNQINELIDGIIDDNEEMMTGFKDRIHADVAQAVAELSYKQNWAYNALQGEVERLPDQMTRGFTNLCQDAISRYFLLYLQSKKLIPGILFSTKQNEDNLFTKENYTSFKNILLGKMSFLSIQQLKNDFTGWLYSKEISR